MPKLVELIEGGFIGQLVLVLLVWGPIAILAVGEKQIPDPLLDAGFIILGFFFQSMVRQAINRQAKR